MKAGLDKAVFTESCFFDTKACGNGKWWLWKPQAENPYNSPKSEANKLTSSSFVLLPAAEFFPDL